MEKYLETMELSLDEIYGALAVGIRDGDICPVFCGSAMSGLGTTVLLDAIVNYFPSPREEGKELDPDAPAKAIIYKTISDQFGKFSLFKSLPARSPRI